MSRILRLCIAVAIVASVCATAALAACSTTATELFKESGIGACGPARYCFNDLCDCLLTKAVGQTYWNKTNNVDSCLAAATAVDCKRRADCLAQTMICLVNAGEVARNDATCATWAAPIHLGVLAYASTNNFTTSSIFLACERSVCQYANASTNPKTCDTTRDAQICACASPLNFKITLTFPNDWSTVGGDQAKLDILRQAFEDDLAVVFGHKICIQSIALDATKQLVLKLAVPQGISLTPVETTLKTTTWMNSVKALSGVPTLVAPVTSNPTPTTANPALTTTAGPTTTSPTTTTAAPGSAARVSAVVAVLVSVALSLLA